MVTQNSCSAQAALQGFAPTATSFIVSVYGDIVVPRGGVLWMGSLIAFCAGAGINESLVRTAVSRLVASGRLTGERRGRRSYYRLAEPAQAEFAEAAQRLYGPGHAASGFVILHAPDLPPDQARLAGYGAMGGGTYLLPDWMAPLPGTAFRAEPLGPVAALAAALWDLDSLAQDYQQMLDRFLPLAADLRAGRSLARPDALLLRLALVHVFRRVLLRDPELPAAALPADWPGAAARALFRTLYPALSDLAESHIADSLEGDLGPLPGRTPRTEARLARMQAGEGGVTI